MKRRRYRSEAEWRRLVEQQTLSGMTGLAFCEQEGLSPKSFYRNRKALQQDSGKTASRCSFVQVMPRSIDQERSTSSLIEVVYRESHLRLPSNTDPVWLAQLMKALS